MAPKKAAAAEDEVGTPSEMKLMLQGLGVKKVQKMADCLAENGIETRKDLSGLDDGMREELDQALKDGGITIGDRSKLKKAQTEVNEVKKPTPDGNEVSVPQLVPGQALQAASKLERLYLGMGWKDKGQSIDVDASCVCFSAGNHVDTIFFQKLRNDSKSLVHTGDVLSGADQAGDEDMERIYIWLQKVPTNVDCIVFVANVYSQGVNFNQLQSAYIRMANADTNQELCRVPLSGKGLKGNCLVFCKLYRTPPAKGAKDPLWQILALGMPTTVQGMASVDQMIPMLRESAAAYPPQAVAGGGDGGGGKKGGGKGSGKKNAKGGGKGAKGGGKGEGPPAEKQQKPRSILPCVALGVATAAGIAAATAIYMNPNLTSDMMNSSVFTSGVNFGADALEWSGDALSGAGDILGEGAGGVYGWAGSVVDQVPGMENIGEGLGCAAEWGGEGLEFGLDGAQTAGGALMDGGAAAAEWAGDGANWENAGETVMNAGGDAAEWMGDGDNWANAGEGAWDAAGDGAGAAWDAAGDAGGAIGGAAEQAGDLVSGGGLCDCFNQIFGAVSEAGGDMVGSAVGVMDSE